MATTRLFRNGHSQAVRIPADLAYERVDLELEIERLGGELRIRPAARMKSHSTTSSAPKRQAAINLPGTLAG